MSRQNSDSPTPDPNRFTITDYTYWRDEQDPGTPEPHPINKVAKPLPAALSRVSNGDQSGTIASSSARQGSQSSQGSKTSSSIVRPLPRIPTNPSTPVSPIAGPSSSSSNYVASPITMTSPSGLSFDERSPVAGASSASTYYTAPGTARTLTDRKGKQTANLAGTQTRPGRNGSGGSSHHRLQLHEPGKSHSLPDQHTPERTRPTSPSPSSTPAEAEPPASRVSTEIDPLPSVHHSVYTQHDDLERDMFEKAHRDEKDIYAAPTLTRNHSEVKHVSFWRRIIPASWVCRWLILVVILESMFDLAILANILWRFNRTVSSDQSSALIWQNKRRLPVYLIIFGLAHLWQIVLTIIAIRGKNTMQVVAVSLFNYAFLAYAVMMLYEMRKILGDLNHSLQMINPDAPPDQIFTIPLNVLTAVLIAVIAVGCVGLTVLAYCIRREFGWQKYRFLGADLQIRKLYQRFQVFECICYFTAFFCAGFGIQFIFLVLQPSDVEYIITWVMFPVLLLLLVFGRFAAKYEKAWMMFVFLIGILAGLAYFTFKLVRIWQQSDSVYQNLSLSLTVFDALSIVTLAACGIWAVWVGSGFGKGLKQAVLRDGGSIASAMRLWRTKSIETDVELSEKEREAQVIAKRRISID